jgi:apolipoprotein N-acyltransferase
MAATVVVVVLVYGNYRLQQSPAQPPRTAQVALLQGTVETVFDTTREELHERRQFAYNQYGELTRQVHDTYDVDLIIWPESMFVIPDLIDPPPPKSEAAEPENPDVLTKFSEYALDVQGFNPRGGESPCRMLVGGHTARFTGGAERHYNSALLIDRSGEIAGRYYKMHLVIFGEYVPLGSFVPWLYNFSPIGPGLMAGETPQAFEAGGLRFSPSVCFESIVPHLIRGQVITLTKKRTPPDVLVNVTNDGWFHGSNCLDQHLACNVFRAVENRRPVLVAANEGLSAHIDGSGRIQSTLPRLRPGVIVSDVQTDARWGLYQQTGDLPAWCLAVFALLSATVGFWSWRRERAASK